MARLGARTIRYETRPCVVAGAAIVGPKEGAGPMGREFDQVLDDDRLGQDTYEKSEAELMTRTAYLTLKKAGLRPEQLQLMIAGDLEQQILAATICARELGAGFLGVYGACSTIAESKMCIRDRSMSRWGSRAGARTITRCWRISQIGRAHV